MPREMTKMVPDPMFGGLAATRWSSTSAHATLKAPHGGGVHGLGCACGCGKCGGGLQGLGGCGCGSRRRSSTRIAGLADLGKLTNLTTQAQTLKPNERAAVTIDHYIVGQPPLGVQAVLDQTNKALLELGYAGVQISKPVAYPLAWSWRWEPEAKVWTAYVSNQDAGPFTRVLDTSMGYASTGIAPTDADTKNLPTQGVVISVNALPRGEQLPPAEQGALREALKRNVRGALGTNVITTLRVYGTPKRSMAWLWGLLAVGTAYAINKGG